MGSRVSEVELEQARIEGANRILSEMLKQQPHTHEAGVNCPCRSCLWHTGAFRRTRQSGGGVGHRVPPGAVGLPVALEHRGALNRAGSPPFSIRSSPASTAISTAARDSPTLMSESAAVSSRNLIRTQ